MTLLKRYVIFELPQNYLHKYFSLEKLDRLSPSIARDAAEALVRVRGNITDLLAEAGHVLVDKLEGERSLLGGKSLRAFPALQGAVVDCDSKIFGKLAVRLEECFGLLVGGGRVGPGPLVAASAVLQRHKPGVLDVRESA